jgi:hypothetical protein
MPARSPRPAPTRAARRGGAALGSPVVEPPNAAGGGSRAKRNLRQCTPTSLSTHRRLQRRQAGSGREKARKYTAGRAGTSVRRGLACGADVERARPQHSHRPESGARTRNSRLARSRSGWVAQAHSIGARGSVLSCCSLCAHYSVWACCSVCARSSLCARAARRSATQRDAARRAYAGFPLKANRASAARVEIFGESTAASAETSRTARHSTDGD